MIGSEVETGRSKTDGDCWMAVGDKHEKNKGNYEDRVNWESGVAGWMVGKDTGFGSSQVVVDSSAGALTGQKTDGRRQDDQRWIRRQ
jgi:hypothetical protein